MNNYKELLWIDQALCCPIYFSQVREDPLIELALLNGLAGSQGNRVLMIASGGCTAALLASRPSVSHLTLVDPNISQLALNKLKLHLLSFSKQERLQILGHHPLEIEKRALIMKKLLHKLNLPLEIFGPFEDVANLGCDYIGRYEQLFNAFRKELEPVSAKLQQLFTCELISEQLQLVDREADLGKALDTAFEKVFAIHILKSLFGSAATANKRAQFAHHFAERLRNYLKTHLANNSPYMAQMLLGHYLSNSLAPWLELPLSTVKAEVSCLHTNMQEFLESHPEEKFDLIHLSNILDWLNPKQIETTLRLAHRALNPNGYLSVRQLNSKIDLQHSLSFSGFSEPEIDFTENIKNERSFFYSNILIKRKKHGQYL